MRLWIVPGDVVLIVGPSGSGKSTLLRRMGEELEGGGIQVFRCGEAEAAGSMAVVDALEVPVEQAMKCLAMAGLSEAALWLRAPAALSEGERHRFRLARFFASEADILLADEFTASLDRVMARVVAWRLGKFVRGSIANTRPRAALVATCHEDVAEDLQPSVIVRKGFGVEVEVRRMKA